MTIRRARETGAEAIRDLHGAPRACVEMHKTLAARPGGARP